MGDLADRRLMRMTVGLALFLAAVILYHGCRRWLAHSSAPGRPHVLAEPESPEPPFLISAPDKTKFGKKKAEGSPPSMIPLPRIRSTPPKSKTE